MLYDYAAAAMPPMFAAADDAIFLMLFAAILPPCHDADFAAMPCRL